MHPSKTKQKTTKNAHTSSFHLQSQVGINWYNHMKKKLPNIKWLKSYNILKCFCKIDIQNHIKCHTRC